MRKLVLFAVLIVALTGAIAAQTGPKAIKFAEFGDIRAVKLKKTIESFCYETKIGNQPQGYIINYGTSTAIKVRRKEIFLSTGCFRTYDPPRITWVDGPRHQRKIWTVLWLIPAGAEPPTP